MKKTKKSLLLAACALIGALLCGCGKTEQTVPADPKPSPESGAAIVFVNGLEQADVWILPETEKNLKTTVWGTATVSKVKTDESRQAELCEPGVDGLYLFRMIDTDSFYYSANGISLEDGWTVEIKENDLNNYSLEVRDKNGKTQKTYDVFSARL